MPYILLNAVDAQEMALQKPIASRDRPASSICLIGGLVLIWGITAIEVTTQHQGGYYVECRPPITHRHHPKEGAHP